MTLLTSMLDGNQSLNPGSAPSFLLTNMSGDPIGRTDASAVAAGKKGQIITATLAFASATSLVTATAKDVTFIDLTAGDWDVEGNVFLNAGSTATTDLYAWMSATSATFPANHLVSGMTVATGVMNALGITCPKITVNVSSTTRIYLTGYATFAVSCTASGVITARRAS